MGKIAFWRFNIDIPKAKRRQLKKSRDTLMDGGLSQRNGGAEVSYSIRDWQGSQNNGSDYSLEDSVRKMNTQRMMENNASGELPPKKFIQPDIRSLAINMEEKAKMNK